MSTLKNFLKIVDYHTFIVTILALLATFICRQLGIIFDLPTNLIAIAIIFPLVFSISGAYRQREEALRNFASIKGHAAALYYAHRDWVPDDPENMHAHRGAILVHTLLKNVSIYFNHCDTAQEKMYLAKVYDSFDSFSQSHETLRQAGLPSNETSRANQYLRAMIIDFEKMRNVARYRTPVALRAYSRLFINVFPIFFAPYFASVAYPTYPFAGYVVAFLYSFVLVSLDNIQDHLENPYDGIGPDDLRIDIADNYVSILSHPTMVIKEEVAEDV